MACLVQTVHLSCIKISTVSKWTELSFHLTLVTLEPSGASKMISEPWYVQCKPSTYLALKLTVSKWIKTHDQCHLGDPSGVSKTISEPVVRSTQTVHLSCIKISTPQTK
jgi:hypothetical protein